MHIVYCMMFTNISDFDWLEASSTPQVTTTKMSLDIVKCPLRGQNQPWVGDY